MNLIDACAPALVLLAILGCSGGGGGGATNPSNCLDQAEAQAIAATYGFSSCGAIDKTNCEGPSDVPFEETICADYSPDVTGCGNADLNKGCNRQAVVKGVGKRWTCPAQDPDAPSFTCIDSATFLYEKLGTSCTIQDGEAGMKLCGAPVQDPNDPGH